MAQLLMIGSGGENMISLLVVLFTLTSFAQDLNSPVVVQTTSLEDKRRNGCWATLYDGKEFTGTEVTIFNGKDIPDLERNRIRSIVAGPAARIGLYPETNYRGKAQIVHPLEKRPQIPMKVINSIKLFCLTLEELRR